MATSSSDRGALAAGEIPRFHLLDVEELLKFNEGNDSNNTKKQINYGLSVFCDFCQEIKADLNDLNDEALDLLLSQFYAGARRQNGVLYSKKTMQALRFSLQRHFLDTRSVDITKDKLFSQSEKTFKTVVKNLKATGKAVVKHHPAIPKEDMTTILQSLDLSSADGLQKKVFIDTMLYFANRGMENLREMKPGDFILHEADGNNGEFFTLRDMHTKNHADDDDESQGGMMCSMPGNPFCPVASLKMYLSKLNTNCEWMWQRPKTKSKVADASWYANVPLGKNTLGSMLKRICEEAGCKIYTNHSLRATSITILDEAGHPSRDIMTVSGHKAESSIKNYARTSAAKKRKMSETLSEIYPNQTKFAEDQPSTSKITVSGSVSEPELEDITVEPETNENAPPLTDSQVERVFDQIPNAFPFDFEPQLGQTTTTVTTGTTSARACYMNVVNRQPEYHFHGCTVNIYNK